MSAPTGSQRDVTERLRDLIERHDLLRQRVLAAARRLKIVASAEREHSLFTGGNSERREHAEANATFLDGEAELLTRAAEEIDDG